jgi:hypothetical protein
MLGRAAAWISAWYEHRVVVVLARETTTTFVPFDEQGHASSRRIESEAR